MFGLFKKKQLPEKLLLLSAIPDDREQFMRQASRGDSDFMRSLATLYATNDAESLWKHYAPSAKALQATFNAVESRGGRVVHNFGLQDLKLLAKYDIVIVIAHHSDSDDEIDVSGQMVRSENFVAAIPEGCKTVIDLTSCYSAYLIPKIKAHIPESRIIGIEVKTKLAFRLFLIDKVVEQLAKNPSQHYIEALQSVLASLPDNVNSGRSISEAESGKNSKGDSDVHLGGKSMSSVYAPKQAVRGEDFIVSVYMHKEEDADEVEIRAKQADDTSEKRGDRRLKIKLRCGDKVDVQLSTTKQLKEHFTIDRRTRSLTWDGDIDSVQFTVSVSPECSVPAFVGNIKVCVNKAPVADMTFRTEIVARKTAASEDCTDFSFTPFDKQAEMSRANKSLVDRLAKRIASLEQLIKEIQPVQDSHPSAKELVICRKCMELLKNKNSKEKNKVLKVFISSTSDMKPYRQAVKERVEACEMYPDMYENWGQDNNYPRDKCCDHVLHSDIFVCLLGAKYGFVEPIWDKSMTEIELRIAQNAGIPILIYIIDNYKDLMEKLSSEERDKSHRQEQLIDEVKTDRMVGIFKNEFGLSLLVNSELLTVKHSLQS